MTSSTEWHLERYRALLRLLVRQFHLSPRFRGRFDSSDLVQETLLKAQGNIGQFRGTTEAELIGWLQQILANTLREEVRKARAKVRDVALEQSLESAVADSSARLAAYLADKRASPVEQAQRQEQMLRVAAAINSLPEDQRTAVIQRDLLGASVAEIAEQMGRTPKSVAGLLLRGRGALRRLLQDEQ
ncbi:MAG TPA: sigma-70 family RNA polymerase sigma factor [Gemmataceae bacterium]|jgi:RNA polymerase sigma-70 factor (ECF subfamily)